MGELPFGFALNSFFLLGSLLEDMIFPQLTFIDFGQFEMEYFEIEIGIP